MITIAASGATRCDEEPLGLGRSSSSSQLGKLLATASRDSWALQHAADE